MDCRQENMKRIYNRFQNIERGKSFTFWYPYLSLLASSLYAISSISNRRSFWCKKVVFCDAAIGDQLPHGKNWKSSLNQSSPDGDKLRSRSPPHTFNFTSNYVILSSWWKICHLSKLSGKKWRTILGRVHSLCLSPFLPSYCLFVCRQIYRAKRRCSFVASEQIRRRRLNRPFLRLNPTTLLGASQTTPASNFYL